MNTKPVVGVAVATLVALLLSGCEQSPEEKAKSAARDVIDLCWSDQRAKSNPPATAQFIAGVCEKLQRDFRERFKATP